MNVANIVAAIALVGTALGAQASVISFSGTTDVTPDQKISKANGQVASRDYSVSLSNYDPAQYDLTSASIKFWLNDNAILSDETFMIKVGSTTSFDTLTGDDVSWFGSTYQLPLSNALADLAADGKLAFTITATSGEFLFDKATVTAVGAKKAPTTAVPEPASLALMGLGLGALALRRRRKA